MESLGEGSKARKTWGLGDTIVPWTVSYMSPRPGMLWALEKANRETYRVLQANTGGRERGGGDQSQGEGYLTCSAS